MEYQARNMHQRGSQTQMWVALLSGDQQAAGDALAGCSLWSVSHDHNGATFVHRSYNLVKHGVIKHRQGICIKKGFKHRRSPEWGSEADLRCIRRMQPLWSLTVSRSDHSTRKQPLWYIAVTPIASAWQEVPHVERFGRKV